MMRRLPLWLALASFCWFVAAITAGHFHAQTAFAVCVIAGVQSGVVAALLWGPTDVRLAHLDIAALHEASTWSFTNRQRFWAMVRARCEQRLSGPPRRPAARVAYPDILWWLRPGDFVRARDEIAGLGARSIREVSR